MVAPPHVHRVGTDLASPAVAVRLTRLLLARAGVERPACDPSSPGRPTLVAVEPSVAHASHPSSSGGGYPARDLRRRVRAVHHRAGPQGAGRVRPTPGR